MKKIIGIFIMVVMVLVVSLPAIGQPQGKAKLKFSGGTMPAVDFAHDLHKEKVSDCKTCHHYGVGTGSCVDCHGGDSRARGKKDAFHDSCRGCHQEMGISKMKDCTFCHKG